MNARLTISLLLLSALGMTGCVFGPFPHTEWTVPPASGRVVDARTLEPIANAQVTRVRTYTTNFANATVTSRDGKFVFAGERTLRWMLVCTIAPAEYHIQFPGYAPFTTNASGWARIHSLRHDFGDIRLQEEAGKGR